MAQFSHAPTAGPGGGYCPINIDIDVTNREATTMALGDVVQLDMASTASETVTEGIGDEGTTVFNNVVVPTAVGIQGGTLGVVLADIAADSVGKIRIHGIVPSAFAIDVGGVMAIGDLLVATTAKNLDGVAAAGERYIGKMLVAKASGAGTRFLAKVEFNGITGFGTL